MHAQLRLLRAILIVVWTVSIVLTGGATAQPVSERPLEHGGGAAALGFDRPGPEHDRDAEVTLVRQLVDSLRAAGELPAEFERAVPTLQWPLESAPHYDRFSYFGISNFVDHDLNYPNAVLDYMCGSRTYDTATGYNHDGTDYFLWPFSWAMMDDDDVHVVAAADGTILFKRDGHYDRQCTWDHGEPANVVFLLHADGSMTRYLHLKKDSLTDKNVGETVEAGEYLGIVGSSGNSTAPHLHFDVWASTSGNLRDPYAGACNQMNEQSLWDEQPPYHDSAINAIITHPAPPVTAQCPNTQEAVNEVREFQPGQTVYLAFYYRDQLAGQVSQYRLLRPNGTTWSQWTHSSPAAHFPASYWWWGFEIPQDAPEGTYVAEAFFEGETYSYSFDVGKQTSTDDTPFQTALVLDLFPNPVSERMSLTVRASIGGPLRVVLYDLLGREVATLHDGQHEAGALNISHDVSRLPAGTYVVRAEAGREVDWRRLTVVR